MSEFLYQTDEIPYGYCLCGCGKQTRVSDYTSTANGYVKGVPRKYIVGHNGRRPLLTRFLEKIDKRGEDDCWEWQGGRTSAGYGLIGLGSDTLLYVHRIAFEHFVRPLNEGEFALHSCDNPPCCNPKHLFAGTNQDNMQDKEAKGRGNHATGERNGQYKHGRYANVR